MMNQVSPPNQMAGRITTLLTAASLLAAVSGLAWWSPMVTHGFLLFHTAAELMSIVVSFAIFALGWFSRDFLRRNWLFLLGVAYGGVATIDLLHTLSYKGLTLLRGSPDLPTQLWVAARLLESAAFVVVSWQPGRRFAPWPTVAAVGAAVLVLLGLIGLGFFPTCYVEGQGLTLFKQGAELLVTAGFVLAGWWMWVARDEFEPGLLRLILVSLALHVVQELSLSFYTDVYGIGNAIGHFAKVIGHAALFRAIFETGVTRPQRLISTAIARERRLASEVETQAIRMRLVLDASPDMMFLLGRDLHFRYVNTAGAALRPFSRDEWTGRHWSQLGLPPEIMPSIEANIRLTLDHGTVGTAEFSLDGRQFEYKVVPMLGEDGRRDNALMVCRDITERHRAALALKQAIADRDNALAEAQRAGHAKSRFLAAASHDLRQPSQATRLFLEVAAMRAEDAGLSALADPIHKAQQAHEGMESLLQTLLNVSTLEAGTVKVCRTVFRLDDLLGDLHTELDKLADDKGLRLRFRPMDVLIDSDPVLLQRVLRNLVHNALRYTHPQSGHRSGVLVGCRRRAGHVRIEVWDTGVGIPADKLDEVFEDFVQVGNDERNREKGLGLGLSVVRRTAELLGHQVGCRSKVGRGSMFSITVPLGTRKMAEREAKRVAFV